MLLLLSTPFGWIQSQTNWIVWKNKTDTIITYNFKKASLQNLRLYITKLQETQDAYNLLIPKIVFKDSLILNQTNQITNQNKMLLLKDSIISINGQILKEAEIWGKKQEKLKIKYQKITKLIPYTFLSGVMSGIILGLLLIK
jgi:hypothetical protein